MESILSNPPQILHATVESGSEDGESFGDGPRHRRGSYGDSQGSEYDAPISPERRSRTNREVMSRREEMENNRSMRDTNIRFSSEATEARAIRPRQLESSFGISPQHGRDRDRSFGDEVSRPQSGAISTERSRALLGEPMPIPDSRKERERNQYYGGGVHRSRSDVIDRQRPSLLDRNPRSEGKFPVNSSSRQYKYPPRHNPTPIAFPDSWNPGPPPNLKSPATGLHQSIFSQRPRVHYPRRERRFWDAYNADPNISGERWGELNRPGINAQRHASYGDPERSTSQQDRPRTRRAYRRMHRSPSISPPPRRGRYPYDAPPYYDRSFNPPVDPNIPPLYGQPTFAPSYGYPYAQPSFTDPPQAFWDRSYPPPSNAYIPPVYRHYPPTYPPYPPPHPRFSQANPHHAFANFDLQQPQPPDAEYYHSESQADTDEPQTYRNHMHEPRKCRASTRYRDRFVDETSQASSSDDEGQGPQTPDRVSIQEAELKQLSSHQNTSQPSLPNIGNNVDEDLLNPAAWAQKVSSTERLVQDRHKGRLLWPRAWCHSDSKTCPKIMGEIWADICHVDQSITHLGLDAVTLPTPDSSHNPKQKGSLSELLVAFETRPLPELVRDVPDDLPVPTFPSDPETLDDAHYEILRLLKVRDYLIMVCRDAEVLNELHLSMDAITWFHELPSTPARSGKDPLPPIVELNSVKLPQLAGIISCLNTILHVIVWGLGSHSSMCLDNYTRSLASHARRSPMSVGFGLTHFSDPVQPKVYDSMTATGGPKMVAGYMKTFNLGLVELNDEMERLSSILSGALNLQCDIHIVSRNAPEEFPLFYGLKDIPSLSWIQHELGCLSELIQGRRVWVLRENDKYRPPGFYEPTSKAHVRTKIIDLAKIWGPIWKVLVPVSQLEDRGSWVWYRLPTGWIGQVPGATPPSQADATPCHFSTDPHCFGSCPTEHSRVPDTGYLLIGHGLPPSLTQRESCQVRLDRGLYGFALQTLGTLAPFRYKDSTTIQVGLNQGGASANWSTLVKTDPGILAKDSFIQRWKLESRFRNPKMLLLWYGIEFSLCTRNARRCRVIDLLRSHVIMRYLEAVYKPQASLDEHVPALFAALKSPDQYQFLILYNDHPEWREELGSVVAHCLELLQGTGVNRRGDLAAFAFMDDAEQLAIVPKRTCTWIGLLKDTFDMATFAVVSPRCLEYPGELGQRCRRKAQTRVSKSVLQTSYMPAENVSAQELFQLMRPRDRLKMKASGKFKIKQRSSNGVLLGTWDPLRYVLQQRTIQALFQEKRQDRELAIKAFVVSKRKQTLVRFKARRKEATGSEVEGGELKQAASSDEDDDADQSQTPPLSSTKSTLPVSDMSSATRKARQAKPSDTSPVPSEVGPTILTPQPQPSSPPTSANPTHPADADTPIRPRKVELVDKGVQAELGRELSALHRASGENEYEPMPTSTRAKGKSKHKAGNPSPILHQGSSNTELVPTDGDFPPSPPSAPREKRYRREGSRQRRTAEVRREDASDAESPRRRSSPPRQRSDASGEASRPRNRRRVHVEDGGSSVRASIAKSFGLGYHM